MKSRFGQWLEIHGFSSGGARLGALVLIPILGACGESTGPERFASITPASQSIALEATPNGRVLNTSVTLTNTSSQSISFDYCALSLERKLEGAIGLLSDGPRLPWVTVWSPICLLASAEISSLPSASGVVEPGTSVIVPIHATASTNSAFPVFDGSPGEYRVHLVLSTRVSGEFRMIPHDLSVSDPFQVTAP